jgi:hypothetical protein
VGSRTYTAEEANQALPEVRRMVEQMVEIVPVLPEIQEQARIAEFMATRQGAGGDERADFDHAIARLRAAEGALTVALTRLEEMDVMVKDAQTGLVDFPGERDGEAIELCWKLGEPRVANWHRVGEGFAGRKPL